MSCLDVRVRKETVRTMEAVWLMSVRHLWTSASVLELGVDFDAKRMKKFRSGDKPHVSISDIIIKTTISPIKIGLQKLLFSINSLAKLLSGSLLLDILLSVQ